VSTLWTPGGEHEPEPQDEGVSQAGGPEEQVDPEVAAQMAQLRQELAATPVADIIANHAIGLWQLTVVHLSPEGDAPPNLPEAQLAIDAMAAMVEGLGERLGDHAAPLRDALSQLRLAFVEVSRRAGGEA